MLSKELCENICYFLLDNEAIHFNKWNKSHLKNNKNHIFKWLKQFIQMSKMIDFVKTYKFQKLTLQVSLYNISCLCLMSSNTLSRF